VVNVQDPENLNRVQIQLYNCRGSLSQEASIWARVAVPFAGAKRGAFFMPDIGDEVLVMFVQGDSRYPIVVGSMWNGADRAPDTFGGSGASVDRWLFVGKAGTRIAIVEPAQGGAPRVEFITPSGVKGTLTDESGGQISLSLPSGTSVELDSDGVTVDTTGTAFVNASEVEITAGQVTVDAAMTEFSGVVQCQQLVATAMVSSPAYTPGAGNVW
jgi:phage baseplate assembly protein gpV